MRKGNMGDTHVASLRDGYRRAVALHLRICFHLSQERNGPRLLAKAYSGKNVRSASNSALPSLAETCKAGIAFLHLIPIISMWVVCKASCLPVAVSSCSRQMVFAGQCGPLLTLRIPPDCLLSSDLSNALNTRLSPTP